MEPHDPQHAVLLEAIVMGEVSATSIEARQLFERCPLCARRHRELSSLQLQLSRAGAEERLGVREAASAELTPEEEKRIRELAAAQALRPLARRSWTRVAVLALAASILGAVGLWFLRPSPGAHGSGETPLGGAVDDVRGLSPRDAAEKLDEFAWEARDLAPDETFSLKITDLERPQDPLVIDHISQARWSRDETRLVDARRVAEFFERAPRRIEWQVEIRNAISSVAQSAALQASQR